MTDADKYNVEAGNFLIDKVKTLVVKYQEI